MSETPEGRRVPPLRPFAALVALTAVTRFALVLYFGTWLGDAGAYEHEQIARSLLAGEGFRFSLFSHTPLPSSHQAPGIPILLAGGYAMFGPGSPFGRLAVECVNVLMAAVAAGSLGWIAFRWWGVRAMSLAMLGFGLFPAFLYMPTRIQAVNWSVTFLILFVACFLALAQRPGSRRLAVATGVTGAVGALGEPILAAPFGCCWLWLGWRARSVRAPAIAMASFVLILSPWLTRNTLVHDRVTFVKNTFWYVFWQGNHPDASGTDKLRVSPEVRRELAWSAGLGRETEALLTAARKQAVSVNVTLSEPEMGELYALPTETAKMRWFEHRVRSYVRENPADYAAISARRLGMLLWFDDTNPRSFVLAYRLPYLALFGLAAFGLASMARARQGPEGFGFWLAAVGSLFLVHTLTIMSARFRLPIEALYVLPAAFAVDRILDRGSTRAWVTCRRHDP